MQFAHRKYCAFLLATYRVYATARHTLSASAVSRTSCARTMVRHAQRRPTRRNAARHAVVDIASSENANGRFSRQSRKQRITHRNEFREPPKQC